MIHRPHNAILLQLAALFQDYEKARDGVSAEAPDIVARVPNHVLSRQIARYAQDHWLDIMESALSDLRFQIMKECEGTFVESDVWEWVCHQREADTKLIQRLRQEAKDIEEKEKPDPADPDNYKPEA